MSARLPTGRRPSRAAASHRSARTVGGGSVTRRQRLRWSAGAALGTLGAGVISGCGMPASAARISAQSPVRASRATYVGTVPNRQLAAAQVTWARPAAAEDLLARWEAPR